MAVVIWWARSETLIFLIDLGSRIKIILVDGKLAVHKVSDFLVYKSLHVTLLDSVAASRARNISNDTLLRSDDEI